MNKEGGISHKLHGLDHLRAFAIIFVFFFITADYFLTRSGLTRSANLDGPALIYFLY